MITPTKIIKTHSKRLSLTINEKGELIVRVPYFLKEEDIFNFIKQKEKWIIKKQSAIKIVLEKNRKLIDYDEFLSLGEVYNVNEVKGLNGCVFVDNCLNIPYSRSSKSKHIRNYLINQSETILLKRLNEISKVMKIKFNAYKLINSKAKWGMCDTNKVIYINWKTIMLPPNLVDYILVHELSHIKHMNHSTDFWKHVEYYIGDYKKRKELLKKSNFVIKLF